MTEELHLTTFTMLDEIKKLQLFRSNFKWVCVDVLYDSMDRKKTIQSHSPRVHASHPPTLAYSMPLVVE